MHASSALSYNTHLRLFRLRATAAVCFSLFSPVLIACGPNFPLQLTQDRQANLQYLPQSVFSQQLAKFAQPLTWQYKDAAAAQEYLWDEANSRYLSQTRAYEHSELNQVQLLQVNALRDATSLAEAEQLAQSNGDTLTPALKWYTLGAVALSHNEAQKAQQYLQKVLDLPAAQNESRRLWALYSLSRIALAKTKDANSKATDNVASFAAATRYLEQIQTQVRQGVADPLRLGLSSLGEQAYILLHQGQAADFTAQASAAIDTENSATDEWIDPNAQLLADIDLTKVPLDKVIALYATQSAEGDSSGYDSLLQLSRRLMALDITQLRPLLAPTAPTAEQQSAALSVQQLLLAYWQSSSNEFAYNGQLSELGSKVAAILTIFPQTTDVISHGDTLAAIYYQLGEYASAENMLKLAQPSGLAWWLTAKIKLQKGDSEAAANAYAQAAKYFPQQENPQSLLTNAPASSEDSSLQAAITQDAAQATYCRIRAEQGVLSLERGEYLIALENLLASGDEYWQDIAYVAERVLSTDELKTFVDARIPQSQYTYPQNTDWYDGIEPLNNRLRYLLGRRLLREGAIHEAPTYFANPQYHASAQKYGMHLTQAKKQAGIDAASSYWQAAILARQQGIEILGFELAPDYAIYQGSFELGYLGDRNEAAAPEQARIKASQAVPDKRFHYRYTAAALANQAADLVPYNSQAYAALLCQATGFILFRDQDLAQDYYQKYVANGPFVPWAENFGLNCQTPDFESAIARKKANTIAKWTDVYHQVKKPLALALVLLLGLGAAWFLRRKKQTKR